MEDRKRRFHAGAGVESVAREWPIERLNGNGSWLLVATVRGQAVARSQGQSLVLEAGDIVLWPPRVRQSYRRSPDCPEWEQRWVVFPDWQRWPNYAQPWPNRLGDAWLQRASPACTAQDVTTILTSVAKNVNRQDDPDQALAANRLQELFIRLRLAQQRQASPDPIIDDACRLMRRNLSHDWSVAELATTLGLSTSRFAHRFRAVVGLAPMAWRDRERMRYAAELLRLQQVPVKAVALQVGYRDPLYFSRAFKRVMGYPPSHLTQQPV